MKFGQRHSWFFALATVMLAACGSTTDFAPETLPVTAIVDMSSVPTGNYKIARVQTTSVIAAKSVKANFNHALKTVGDPDKGDDTQFNIETSEESLQVSAEINLPFSMEAKDGKLKFTDKHYYWNYVRGDKSWQWSSSGSESTKGAPVSALFEAGSRESEQTPVYRVGDTARASIRVEGEKVKVFVEVKSETEFGDALTIVVLTYQKV
jgi:hypothetical protein